MAPIALAVGYATAGSAYLFECGKLPKDSPAPREVQVILIRLIGRSRAKYPEKKVCCYANDDAVGKQHHNECGGIHGR